MNVKLLLDEMISPKLAQVLCDEDGVDACAVRDRGLLEATDAVVLEKAFQEDRLLVTKNVDDFEQLAGARELHAGIVLLEDGGLNRAGQLRAIRTAIVALANMNDMANKVLRIAVNGTPRIEELPTGVTS